MTSEATPPRRTLLAGAAGLSVMLLLTSSPALAAPNAVPPGFAERVAEVNGTRLHYMIGGQGSPVVLLHGYAETSHMWLPVMPLLGLAGGAGILAVRVEAVGVCEARILTSSSREGSRPHPLT